MRIGPIDDDREVATMGYRHRRESTPVNPCQLSLAPEPWSPAAIEKMLLNPAEAAMALSISRSRLYELMAAERIGSVRIDSCRRVPVRALQDYVDRPAQENSEDLSAA